MVKPFFFQKINGKTFFPNRNRKKSTADRKMHQILTLRRKSHHPIENLFLEKSEKYFKF